jgi:hypothetical protein
LNFITDLQALDAALGTTVSGFPWVVDDITLLERSALRDIAAITAKDLATGKIVAGLPWITFNISQDEGEALTRLKESLTQEAAVAKLVTSMPFLTTSFKVNDKDALISLLHLATNHPAVLTSITTQAWFVDGLDDQEARFVTVASTPQGPEFDPENLNALILKRYAASNTAKMPLSGDLLVTSFQTSDVPRNRDLIGQAHDSVRLMEGFLGIAFPQNEVNLLIASPLELNKRLDYELSRINRGNHILINPELGRQGDTNRVITQELALYYWGSKEVPLWFQEDGTTFLASYVRETLFGESLEERSIYPLSKAVSVCQSTGLSTINNLIEKLAPDGLVNHQNATYFTCNNDQGENLVLSLYNTLCEDDFQSSWRDIYELA